MKITCQSCQSKYTVSDEKVQGKTVKIKCRKCGSTIIVNSSGVASQVNGGPADPVSTTGGSDGSYLVNVTEGDQRNMSMQELVAAYQQGVVNADTYVWADGMADWLPISQVETVVAALNTGVAPSAPPPPAAAPTPSPEPMAAAAPEPAPRAAAVRRDPARRSQDLFGGGMAAQTAQDDVATSAPLFSAPAASPLTGQRDENSTLFSLSALTAKAGTAPVAAPANKTTATKEDSGLIDLKALAESGGAAAPTNLVPDHAGLFPLGVPQITAAPASSVGGAISVPEAPSKKSPIPIIIGSVVATLAIVGVFFLVKGGGEKPAPTAEPVATAATPPPAPTPTATAAAEPTASASADPEAESSADAKSAKGKKGGGKGGGGKGKAPAGGGAKAPAGGGDPPPAAKPAGKGNCGCAAGDLMCAMKCSAGK